MRVSFIGMSNIGKSHWARRIAVATGCRVIACDTLIERRLAPELEQSGFHGLRGMGRWMGLPDAPQHEENSRLYMKQEQEVMRDCLARLQADPQGQVVVDTTGSVIYTDDATRAELRDLTRVVYFEASPDHVDQLFRNYIANPKPTIWAGLYQPQQGEAARQTMKRCYPILLRERALRYQQMAHVTIPYHEHKAAGIDVKTMLNKFGVAL